MASSYTTNLRIELQGTGDHRSSWGAVANTDFSLLEEGIAKLITVDVPDANLTLTATNGASDQSRPMFIVFTGTLTQNRTITIPPVSKLYIMRNTTIGGFSLTISNGGQTSVIPPTGSPGTQWKVIFTDGANVFSNDDVRTYSNPGQRWNLAPYVDNTGSMEIGRYIDFHNTNSGDADDWNVRLETGGTTSDLYIAPQGQVGRKVWNSGNDGAASGLDADMLDGFHAVDLGFPTNTSMLFWQSAAPTGWTKVTTHNDKALRVVSGTVTSGGSTAFSSVFTPSRVPAGSISGTALTEAQLAPHDHPQQGTFNTGTESADHVHGINLNTGGQSQSHTHAGDLSGHPFVVSVGGAGGQGTSGGGFSLAGNTNWADRDHVHNVSGNTGGRSAAHFHAVTISGNTANAGSGATHTHAFTGTAMNFDVAYVDLIIATKNAPP